MSAAQYEHEHLYGGRAGPSSGSAISRFWAFEYFFFRLYASTLASENGVPCYFYHAHGAHKHCMHQVLGQGGRRFEHTNQQFGVRHLESRRLEGYHHYNCKLRFYRGLSLVERSVSTAC